MWSRRDREESRYLVVKVERNVSFEAQTSRYTQCHRFDRLLSCRASSGQDTVMARPSKQSIKVISGLCKTFWMSVNLLDVRLEWDRCVMVPEFASLSEFTLSLLSITGTSANHQHLWVHSFWRRCLTPPPDTAGSTGQIERKSESILHSQLKLEVHLHYFGQR